MVANLSSACRRATLNDVVRYMLPGKIWQPALHAWCRMQRKHQLTTRRWLEDHGIAYPCHRAMNRWTQVKIQRESGVTKGHLESVYDFQASGAIVFRSRPMFSVSIVVVSSHGSCRPVPIQREGLAEGCAQASTVGVCSTSVWAKMQARTKS